ncbi:MAG: class II aldolase/adducin family protein [Armatimonadota bacterium]|nr:class II aldolase/adducin family protein [bacterium]
MQETQSFIFQDSKELRRSVIDACLYLSRIGFCVGTWGNISVRLKNGLLITPSRVDYSAMKEDDLVVCDWEGVKVSGHRPPSSEMHLHRMLMLRRPDMGAIVHTHSTFASVLAVTGASIPVIVEDMAQIIGGEVRCTPYRPGGKHIELATVACDTIGNDAMAVLLANHGPVAGGRDLAEAVVACEVLEKAAKLRVFSGLVGPLQLISGDEATEERNRFLYKYGKEE